MWPSSLFVFMLCVIVMLHIIQNMIFLLYSHTYDTLHAQLIALGYIFIKHNSISTKVVSAILESSERSGWIIAYIFLITIYHICLEYYI